MNDKIKKILEGDSIVTLLVWAALLVFIVNMIMGTLPAIPLVAKGHILTALISILLAIAKSVYQPLLLLGLAKLISLKTGSKNA